MKRTEKGERIGRFLGAYYRTTPNQPDCDDA